MKIGTKVVTKSGFLGEITSFIQSEGFNNRRVVNVKLEKSGQTYGYYLDSLKRREPKPIKLKKFSAWK